MVDELITLAKLPGQMMKVSRADGSHAFGVQGVVRGVWDVYGSAEIALPIIQLRRIGSQLTVLQDDGTTHICQPVNGSIWRVIIDIGGVNPPDGDSLVDWWTIEFGQGSFGDWESHAWYSRGGTDWSTPMDYPLKAPASGVIRNYPDEDAAGLKTMIIFDKAYPRLVPASPTLMNGVYYENPAAPAVAFMAQHLNRQVPEGRVNQGDVFAYSGNSAGPGNTGATHLHAQLLASDSVGADRLDFMKFRTEER